MVKLFSGNMKTVDSLAYVGVTVSAIAHGGLALGYDIVGMVANTVPIVTSTMIYGAVGVAGAYSLYQLLKK